jgi:Transposase, Mutator family
LFWRPKLLKTSAGSTSSECGGAHPEKPNEEERHKLDGTTTSSRYGILPDPALDPKEFKKILMERLRARGGTASIDTKQLFQSMVKETLEGFLELELEPHLGYAKHEPEGRGSGNSRHGATPKTVRGDFGAVEIEIPRDRNVNFEPKIVAKRQTSVGNFSEAVISL